MNLLILEHCKQEQVNTSSFWSGYLFNIPDIIIAGNINLWSTELINLNFQPLGAVSRYRDPQLQVTIKIGLIWSIEVTIYMDYCRFETYLALKNLLYESIKTKENNIIADCGRYQCSEG